jgi:hypothetical protein
MFSLFVLYIWQRNSQYQSSAPPSLRSLFLASVFFCGLEHSGPSISTSVLIDSAYKHQFNIWMNSTSRMLGLPIHDDIISFSKMVTKRKHQKHKDIIWFVHRLKFVWNGQGIKRMYEYPYLICLLKESTLLVSNNSKPSLCSLENRVDSNTGLLKIMIHGDALFRRGSEFNYRVFATGLYSYWISLPCTIINDYLWR